MNCTVAIMQPYVFPYIGYFCLAEASDVFVFYDDVNFITRGWINRNRVLINGSPYKFTIPLSSSSQHERICDVTTHDFSKFRNNFLKQIQYAYSKSPFYKTGLDYVEMVLSQDVSSISDIAISSVKEFYSLIGDSKKFLRSSEVFNDSIYMNKADRLIDITKALHSTNYVNSIGGTSLYEKSYFRERGVELHFVKPHFRAYKQMGTKIFLEGLSIIDVIMNNDVGIIMEMIKDYELL